jgi:hypothetical protein
LPRLLAALLKELSGRAEKAFDFAQDLTKQLITLATGTIALTITFLHDLAANASTTAIRFLEFGWVSYGASIILGIATLMHLTGNLESENEPSIYRGTIKTTSIIQIVLFLLGVALTLVFGFKAHDLAHVTSP